MRENFEAYFLLILLFFFSTLTFSQTVIKEKVSINPAINLSKITAENDSCTLTVQVTWNASSYEGFIGIVNNAGWFATSGWVGGGSISISATVSSLNVGYLQLRLNLDENVESDYSYTIILNGVTVQHGVGKLIGRFLYVAYTNIELNPSVFSGFRLDLIDDRTGSNTNQLLLGHTISTTLMPYVKCNPIPSLTRASLVSLSLSPQIENVAFFDYNTSDNLGISFSAPLGEFDQYYISLEPDYYSSEEKEIYVTATSGDYSITDTLIIPPVTYSIYTYPEIVELVNDYEIVNVNTYSEGGRVPLSDSIRYNLEITRRKTLISIIKISSGEQGKSFYNIEHVRGKLDFEIIRENEQIVRDDTAIVKISTTNPNITPKELKVIYHAPKIDVKFSPSTIAPGDTANVILKKKNDDGTLVDFPQDQYFDVNIKEGASYGTLYLPQWGDQSDEFLNIPAGFKFIASEQITESMVESTILVKTSSGIIAGSIQPGNTLTNKSIRQLKKTTAMQEGDEVLWGEGTIMVVKGFLEPELVILRPLANSSDERISPEPKMPELKAEAQLKNFTGGVIHYTWEFTVRWTGPDGRLFNDEFTEKTEAQNAEVSAWAIAWEGKTRGGDNIALRVTTVGKGKTYQKSVTNPFKIIGENPTVTQVRAGLSLQEQVVVYLESFPKWQHFNSQGFPIFGFPHGYGLMQLDNPRATNEQVWNWRENRAGGATLLAEKKLLAEGYTSRVRSRGGLFAEVTDFTEEQLLTDMFQLYNGFHYWVWMPRNPRRIGSGGAWVRNPNLPRDYGREAIIVYRAVQDNNPPPGW